MPSRRFTSGRKFSTTTSAFLTMRLNAAKAAGALRLSVMLRLLRCRFWKSDPSRGPPSASPPPGSGGNSILITLAPQSASWRTQVGPARTRVRSRTVKRSSAREALGTGLAFGVLRGVSFFIVLQFSSPGKAPGSRHSLIYRPLSTEDEFEQAGLYTLWSVQVGRCNIVIGRLDDYAPADHPLPGQAQPDALGVRNRRHGYARERAGAPAPPTGAAERTTCERAAARGTSARKRAAAIAGRRRDGACGRDSRRQFALHRDRGNVLAVRSVGRAFGRSLLHRLCRKERRRCEPSRHFCLQRRTWGGVGLSQFGTGRSAHPRVSRQRCRRRPYARQSCDLARIHRSGHDRSGRRRLE